MFISKSIKIKEDFTGKQFNRWHVINRADDRVYRNGKKISCWRCWCDCEKEIDLDKRNIHILSGSDLKRGHSKSCGCIKKEQKENALKKQTEEEIEKKKELQNKKYDLSGEYGIGYTNNTDLHGRNYFYFDLEDYEKIKNYTWYFGNKGEVLTKINHTSLLLHRLIMGVDDFNIQVDHIKHKRYDNRKSQLRIVDNSKNQMNTITRKDNTSGKKGVAWHKGSMRWYAYINKDKKRISLGYYDNIENAINARINAENKYHNEYSYDNSVVK